VYLEPRERVWWLLVSSYLCQINLKIEANYVVVSECTVCHRVVAVTVTVTVTVTEALVLRPLLEDRGRITESIHILVPMDTMKQKCLLHST